VGSLDIGGGTGLTLKFPNNDLADDSLAVTFGRVGAKLAGAAPVAATCLQIVTLQESLNTRSREPVPKIVGIL
jgi:hypothetical protein